MDAWSRGSSERAHGTRRARKYKKHSGTLRGMADWRTGGACDGAVLLLVDRDGTYTMGSLDVQGCDDVPILWLPAKSNERSYEQRSQVWARNYNNKGHSSRASCATVPILVLDCFTSCLCSSRGLPRPPTNAYTVVIGSEAEQRRFNAG